ncbi:MAG: hypothetical protein PHW75_02150 [Patescibacteria group bacterium]|nr:hypothetical protein [Patescibacteria group bacterium]
MKIPNEYPKFISKKTLLVVMGRENGKFYMAEKGFLSLVTEFGERVPKYSDREGFFIRLGRGKYFGSGSVYGPKIKEVEKRFMTDFRKEFLNVTRKNNFDQIYLFAPRFMHKYVEDEIPVNYRDIIKYRFAGNFQKEHPLKLLEIIGKEIEREHPGAVPVKEEARKILKKFKVINNR